MNEIGYKTESWVIPLARDCDINFMYVPFSQESQKEVRKLVGKSSYLQQERDHHEGNCNLIIASQPRKLSLSTDKQRLTTIKIVGYHLSD